MTILLFRPEQVFSAIRFRTGSLFRRCLALSFRLPRPIASTAGQVPFTFTYGVASARSTRATATHANIIETMKYAAMAGICAGKE